MTNRDDISADILRESVLSRSRQAGMAFAVMAVNAGLTLVLVRRGIEPRALVAWLGASTLLLAVRWVVARRARVRLGSEPHLAMLFDRQFRYISMASQLVTGAGIWLTTSDAQQTASYLMTMLICLYSVGTIVNLAHDYRTVRLSLPLLLGQPLIFWLWQGSDGIVVAVILAGLFGLMLAVARTSQGRFEESIRIRFDKDELLKELRVEQGVLNDTLKELEAANRSKSFFMAAASHDLRQPLYAASILRDALALHDLPPEAAKLVEQQRSALTVAGSLFDNLLDLSRFESGVIETRIAPVHVPDVLAQIESEFTTHCRTRGLAFHLQPQAVVVMSDFDLLTRLLRNLVSNAVRYTRAGSISVSVRSDAEHAHIAVSDSGIGIAVADQERIFEEFVQLPNTERRTEKGVGLGLAIVRHILRVLDHRIAVQSAPGVGTTMTVTLPLAVAQPTAAEVPHPLARAVSLAGRTGWVVEDDPLVRAALTEYLGRLGARCHSGQTRRDLSELEAAHGAPDFVILDDMLGDSAESGLELAQWLVTRVPRQNLLLTTGSAQEARLKELMDSGISVCRKPVPAAVLNDWLLACTGRH